MSVTTRWPLSLPCLAVFVMLMTTGGCSIHRGASFEQAFATAHRARTAGRHADARDGFRKASTLAERKKDAAEALFLVARMQERLEQWPEAKATYRALRDQGGWRAGRAAFDLARLERDHGNPDDAHARLTEAIAAFPHHGNAHHGLRLWLGYVRDQTGSESKLRQLLNEQIRPPQGSELHQQVMYEVAHSLRREGQLAEARAAFLSTAALRPYPRGSFTDDAYWHASQMATELGNPRAAITDLEAMLDRREQSNILFGSYDRPRFAAARFRIGKLYRDDLGELEAARKAFRKTYRDHPTSILADDAMWEEATIERDLKRPSAACGLLTDLIARFPTSRYAGCLSLVCPHLMPPQQGRTHCPDYLKKRAQKHTLDEAASP